MPIGWIGVQIDDVEAERGDVGQPRDAIVEGAVAGPAPCPGCAAPSRTRRRRAPAAGRRSPGWRCCGSGRRADRLRRRPRRVRPPAGFRRPRVRSNCAPGPVDDAAWRCASRAFSSPRSSRPSWASSATSMAGLALEQQAVAPGGELVGPGFDREQIAARLGRGEAAVPAVVAVPGASARAAIRSRFPSATAIRRPVDRAPRGANRPRLQSASPAMRLTG